MKRKTRHYLVVVPISYSGGAYSVRSAKTHATSRDRAYNKVKGGLLLGAAPILDTAGNDLFWSFLLDEEAVDFSQPVKWEPGARWDGTSG